MPGRDVKISYIGDSSSAERASRRVGDANQRLTQNVARMHTGISSKFGSLGVTFRRFGQVAAVGIAGAGFLAVKLGTDFVKAAEESNKVAAQTGAVLESTGGVARVTADHVSKLSDQLSIKAGIDDELIQSGQNVLLTFTSIRNEVGKGNDIFDQATRVALDMSVALGQDMQSSVIQLGKALQDPIRGITALRRVGVNFSTDQVEMIKKLVETGDTLGAQKLILRELTTEFGGSAEAQATASGKLSVAWGNLQEELGKRLLPLVEKFSTWMIEKGIPAISSFADWVSTKVVPAVKDLGTWLGEHVVPKFATLGRVLTETVVPAVKDLVEWIGQRVNPVIEKLSGLVDDSNKKTRQGGIDWKGWGVTAGLAAAGIGVAAAGIAAAMGGVVVPAVKGVATAFGLAGAAATFAFSFIIRNLPFAHIASLAYLFRDKIVGAFGAVKDGVVRRWRETWELVSSNMASWGRSAVGWFRELPGRIQNAFGNAGGILFSIGRRIISGLWNGLKDAWKSVKGWFGGLGQQIKDLKGPPEKDYHLLRPAGVAIMGGFFEELRRGQGPIFNLMRKLGLFFGEFFGGAGIRPRGPGIAGLYEPLASAVAGIIAQGRGAVSVISGWRSSAQQASLYQRWLGGTGNRAAPPGRSYHEKGLAVDLGGNRGLYTRLAHKFGLIAPVRGEPWHWQPAGTSGGRSYYATGGVVPGPVGAPQTAVVHGGEAVFTPDQIRALGGRRGATTVINYNLTFNGPTNDKQVVEALKREVRMNGPLPIRVRG